MRNAKLKNSKAIPLLTDEKLAEGTDETPALVNAKQLAGLAANASGVEIGVVFSGSTKGGVDIRGFDVGFYLVTTAKHGIGLIFIDGNRTTQVCTGGLNTGYNSSQLGWLRVQYGGQYYVIHAFTGGAVDTIIRVEKVN